MCKNHHIDAFVDQLVHKLSPENEDDNTFGKRSADLITPGGDVYCDWIDNSEAIVDFVSCNVANDTLVQKRKFHPVSALEFKAKEKHRKYDKDIEKANADRNRPLVFIDFQFCINGRLSLEAVVYEFILLNNQSPSPSDFEEQLARSGCEINLDDSNNKLKLTSLLKLFSDVFSDIPNRKGIYCNPLTIPFRDENAIEQKIARRLNPSKMEIANKIFDELIEMGYAVESNYKFSSPIVLVIYPDGKKPRLTGDFSGKDGVNAHTISVEPNLPRISDILEFLSRADYIATLDLLKAFWQMNVAEKDIEKTSISIPGRSIIFKSLLRIKEHPSSFSKRNDGNFPNRRRFHIH
ncbi:hypothetical protein P9112_001760 [Eukaryota sp. TZLM1-RC]